MQTTRRREIFTTIHTEGAILPADLLGRIADNDRQVGGLRSEDYRRYGERLNEAISHSWNRLLGVWTAFQERIERVDEDDPAIGLTRERWLLPLFEELGYGRLSDIAGDRDRGQGLPDLARHGCVADPPCWIQRRARPAQLGGLPARRR